MLDLILKVNVSNNLNKRGFIPLLLEPDSEYILKAKEIKNKSLKYIIKIRKGLGLRGKIKKFIFIKECRDRFNTNEIKLPSDNNDLCYLSYKLPTKSTTIQIDITKVNKKLINCLNTNEEKKEEIYKISEYYLNDNSKEIIREIGLISEYIAKEVARKIKRHPKDFRNSVNILMGHKMTKKSKINYEYLGSLLRPIYYIRNQSSHPTPKIGINNSVAKVMTINFSEVLRYLADNRVQF